MKKIYSILHNNLVDKLIIKKRQEMCDIINLDLKNHNIIDALDIGTTNDMGNKSSNYLIKNLKNIKIYKSLSDQKINDSFFVSCLQKSITADFSIEEIQDMKSDLVISSATIEHVGSIENQIRMLRNMKLLSKKFFVITTPSRFHPIDFHTKIPFIHWFPKKIHRRLLKILGLNFFSYEENLNLLSKKDLINILMKCEISNYKIFSTSLLGFKSNFIIIGTVKD